VKIDDLKSLPDPGPGPWCPNCGAPAQKALAVPQGPGFPNSKKLGVCAGCGAVCHPEFSVAGEVLPFLRRQSDLAVLPPPISKLVEQVRAEPPRGRLS
jgi:hypothetical protein